MDLLSIAFSNGFLSVAIFSPDCSTDLKNLKTETVDPWKKISMRSEAELGKISPSSSGSGSSSTSSHKHHNHHHHHHHHHHDHKKHHKKHDAHNLYSTSERELLQISPLKIVIRDPLKATGAISVFKEEVRPELSGNIAVETDSVVSNQVLLNVEEKNLSNHVSETENEVKTVIKIECNGKALKTNAPVLENPQSHSDLKCENVDADINSTRENLDFAVPVNKECDLNSPPTYQLAEVAMKATVADSVMYGGEDIKIESNNSSTTNRSELENIPKSDLNNMDIQEKTEAANSFPTNKDRSDIIELNSCDKRQNNQSNTVTSCDISNSLSLFKNDNQEHSIKLLENGIANRGPSASSDTSAATVENLKSDEPFKHPYNSPSKDTSSHRASALASTSTSKHKSSLTVSSSSNSSYSKSSHHSTHKDKASHHSSKSHSSGRSSSSSSSSNHHNASSKSHRDHRSSSSSSSRSSKSRESRGVQVNLGKEYAQGRKEDILSGNIHHNSNKDMIFKWQHSMSHIESLTRIGLNTQHSQFPVLPKFCKYVHIEKYSNGGAFVVHSYHSELAELCKSDMEEFVNHYFDLVFGEPVEGESRCVMGIVHGAASPMPDFLDYLVETDPNLSVKTGSKGKSDIETTTISKFREQVKNYCLVCFLPFCL